ncbi:hypothetical protein [Niastella populi]|uniref:Uncharacterized protein n=1 Tax=Niastella populi TaxID=550983 RepID=A0A1V9G7M9_9BACT|nr:hypothetical protein [Niastella populi]OQP66659.1 hypothetical protein A4R26_12840 [Niastella populi]
MRSILLLLFAFFCSIGKGFCQAGEGQAFGEDIKEWLKPGEHKVELMGIKSTTNPREMELTSKIMKAAQKNAAWIRDSMEKVSDSAIIYEKFGLTRAEYYEYINMDDTQKKQELVKTGDEKLVIKRKKNTLTFKGTGRLKALDSLKFNVVLNEPIYNGKELEFSNRSGAEDDKNPFKSPWTGYHYTYEALDDIEADMEHYSATTITFDIGRLKSGKSVIMFMLMKVKDGKPVQSATAICLFE